MRSMEKKRFLPDSRQFWSKPLRQSRLFDCLALMLNKERMPATRPHPSALQSLQAKPKSNNGGLIPAAEDNAVNQKVALLLLKELGFSADVVGNGREAIEAITRTKYSLVFMDCQMPELDGMEATGEIRRMEAITGRHVPVVAMTAHAMQGDREKCIAAGMDDYISKPVTASKLNEILQHWLPRTTSETAIKTENESPDQLGIAHLTNPAHPDDRQPPPLDWEGLKLSCGKEGAAEILQIFVDSSRDILRRLEKALNANDVSGIKAASHELRGASTSVGSQKMATTCKRLEEISQDKNADFTQAKEHFQELNDSFEHVILFSKKVLIASSP